MRILIFVLALFVGTSTLVSAPVNAAGVRMDDNGAP
jgi:hypothetical protein